MPNKKDRSINKNFVDSIYELFQSEEVTSNYQDLDDNISYEASQIRLIILGSIFATLFSIIATLHIALFLSKISPIQPMILIYRAETKPRFPHVALISPTGKMNIYEFKSTDHIVKTANFTLQKMKDTLGYFAFDDQNSIHIICSDMRKVHSIIDGHNQYYSIHNTNENIKRILSESGHTRVGNFLWIFGGNEAGIHGNYDLDKSFDRTLLWHITKQRWIWGPWIPQEFNSLLQSDIIKGASGIAINQTVGMIVFPNFEEPNFEEPNCLAYMIYNFKAFNWTDINVCFFKLSKKLDFFNRLATTESASSFDKDGEMYDFLSCCP